MIGIRIVIAAHISQCLVVTLKMKSKAPGALLNQWDAGQRKNQFLLYIIDKYIVQMEEKTEDQKGFLTETFNISPVSSKGFNLY